MCRHRLPNSVSRNLLSISLLFLGSEKSMHHSKTWESKESFSVLHYFHIWDFLKKISNLNVDLKLETETIYSGYYSESSYMCLHRQDSLISNISITLLASAFFSTKYNFPSFSTFHEKKRKLSCSVIIYPISTAFYAWKCWSQRCN